MSADAQLGALLDWLWHIPPPADVQEKARLLVLDTVGCVLAASRKPALKRLAAQLAKSDPGAVLVVGFAERLSVPAAAALFATAACWDEACEGLARAHGRPGVPVIAACSALSQVLSAGTNMMLQSVICGYEVGGRLGEAVRIPPGAHVDATWPGFGVAAAVVRLSRGNHAQALAAVRTAACQMPRSLYVAVKEGAEARNTYLAHSAQLGLLAANAALSGFTAPEGALAELGAQAIAEPGAWFTLEGYLKPYAAVRHTHYGAAAAEQLRGKVGARVDDIRSIELSVYPEALVYCGNRAPRTPIQAQFSLSYAVACMLLTGELGPDSYDPKNLDDPRLGALEAKVRLVEDARYASRRGARLSIDIGGETLASSIDALPAMTRDEVLAKFRRYAGFDGVATLEALSRL
jgi:2-methylcitrate dehydratase PrpD